MPEISIIVPVYNVETKLKRCLDSIQSQTYSDFEVILVDDGSKDGSGKICDEYALIDKRFKAFHLQNGGASAARNFGIENAAGKYIAFVDSDDYVEKQYLEVLKKGVSKTVPLSICGVYYCAEGVQEKSAQKEYEDFTLEIKPENEQVFAELISNRRFNYVYGKLYEREIIQKNELSFWEDVSLGEDTIFVLEYLKNIQHIRVIGKAYYNYIKYQSGTLTGRVYPDQYEKYTFINNQIEDAFKGIGVYGNAIQNVINIRRIESARWAIDGFRKSNLDKKNCIQSVSRVLESQPLKQALIDCTDLDAVFPDIKWIRTGSSKKLLRYYRRTERREKIVKGFKTIVVKIVPKNVIRRVKKWLSNVRS